MLTTHDTLQASAGAIDSVENLEHRRVLLYHGKSDTTYNNGSVRAAFDFFKAFVPETSLRFVTNVSE